VFKLDLPVSTVTINPGAQAAYTLTLTNQGATDRWNLILTGATTGWSLYADTDGSGALNTTDAALTDTTGDGTVDTGRIDPSTTFRFFLTRLTAASEPAATTATTITATSVGQPGASGAVKSVVATTVVIAGAVGPTPAPTPTSSPVTSETVCAAPTVVVPDPGSYGNSYTETRYALHNDGDVLGNSALQPQMYFNLAAADESALGHYSTDISPTTTGRIMLPTGASSPTAADVIALTALTDKQKFADWAMQFGSTGKVDGTGVLHLWAARYSGGTSPVSLKVVLYSATGSTSGLTRTVIAQQEISLSNLPCTGFQEFYVKLPDASDAAIAKDDWVGVRVVTWGADKIRLGYDEPTQFPASFTIGVK
jgi:hypothetical protein